LSNHADQFRSSGQPHLSFLPVHEIFVTSECDLSMIEGSALTLGGCGQHLRSKPRLRRTGNPKRHLRPLREQTENLACPAQHLRSTRAHVLLAKMTDREDKNGGIGRNPKHATTPQAKSQNTDRRATCKSNPHW